MHDNIEWLCQHLDNAIVSQVYETAADNGSAGTYLNAVMMADTDIDTLPRITRMLKQREAACGRNLMSKITKAIPIDIDIVMFDGEVVRPDDFTKAYFRIGYTQLTAHPL
jgi:7,8-dihydro-6-hydroxymethylpterin-pyrophosphokinase